MLSIVDDPVAAGAPGHARFDDEGVPTARRTLVGNGTLVGYLGSREFMVPGAEPGNAWSLSAGAPPRPAASNTFIRPADAPISVDEPVLCVAQSRGMHLSNDITGDFSLGGSGFVARQGELVPVTGFTVAGNVFDLFRSVVQVGADVQWTGGPRSFHGSPDLLVTGLSVGV
jgi:PmbA protein